MKGPIGVLCGGPSREREISIRSGKAIDEALRSRGFEVRLLELSEDPAKIPEEIKKARLKRAFIALHGFFGEDGQVQQILTDLGIPYTGSSPEASRCAMDKVACRQRWAEAGLPIPQWNWAHSINGLQFPLVVKPVAQGSSIGMSIVDRREELPAAVHEAQRYGEKVLVEEYLAGEEITVGILEDAPLPIIQIVPKRRFYDYVAKYTPGMTEYLVPAPLSSEVGRRVQQRALEAHRLVGCRSFSRVDMILVPERGPILLEINTIPGMTASSLLPKAASAVGIDFATLCIRMLATASVTE